AETACSNGVGRGKAVQVPLYRRWLRKESSSPRSTGRRSARRCHQRVGHVARARGQTATATNPHGIQESIMSPAKRDTRKQGKARQRRRLHAQERLERDRRQAQQAAEALAQALYDLGLPENLVAEIEGRLRSQQK